MRTSTIVLAGIFALTSMVTLIQAAEHPAEHPKEHPAAGMTSEKKIAEHPKEEKQAEKVQAVPITMENLAKAITDYVAKDSTLKGGYFLVYDPMAKAVLQLVLDHVHKDRLSRVSEGVYFVCADFKTPKGKIYDLDIFMKGADASSLQVTEISVHKEAGKARYGWVEENGIWKKKQS